MRVKTIIGIILMLLSIAGLLYWESIGRENFTTTEILAASKDLQKGQVIENSDIKILRLSKEKLPAKALKPEEANLIIGKTLKISLSENQILEESFADVKNSFLLEGYSIFQLPQNWIASRPSVLRSGDKIGIYALPEEKKLGSYEIAFVRDSQEQAIKDLDESGEICQGEVLLNRNYSAGIINSVEIICRPEDFLPMYQRSIDEKLWEEKPEISEETPEENQEENSEEIEHFEIYEIYEEEEEIKPFLLLVIEE